MNRKRNLPPNRIPLFAFIFILGACTSAPQAGAADGSGLTAGGVPTKPVIELAMTASLVPSPTQTPIPSPSPTPPPLYEIHDPTTWPADMQEYFNGSAEDWSDPEQGIEFETFIQQVRRDHLFYYGLANAQNLDTGQVFNEYLKWGVEHPTELLVFSIQELRDMLNNSLQRDTAIFAYQDGNTIQNGIYADFFTTGTISLSKYNELISTREAREHSLTHLVTINVLGSDLTLLASYYGAYGDLIARFRLPGGIDPRISEGILVHFSLHGTHAYLPLIINYEPVILPSGATIVTGYENVIQYSGADTILPVRSSVLPAENDATSLGPEAIQDLIGTRALFEYNHMLLSKYNPGMIFPYALGIPNTSVILQLEDAIEFTEPILSPWVSRP